jgi:Uma2 family endonuclease
VAHTMALPVPKSELPTTTALANVHLQLAPAVLVTQDQFYNLCQQNPRLRLERTAQGELIIMPPSGGETGRRNLSVGAQLYYWAQGNRSGEAYDSSTGFILPNGANRSPDACWIHKSRLTAFTAAELERFIPLCPDFVVEVMSPTDSLTELQAKMEEYITNGAQLGWLIDPNAKQVSIFRPGQTMQVLDGPTSLSADPELCGFVLDLQPIWPA